MPLDPKLLAAMKPLILGGRYNVLLGAGASLGGLDRHGEPMPTGEELRKHLVSLSGINVNSSLARASNQLSADQIEKHLTLRFSGCTPGPAAVAITRFFWRRIYTFNVDDCLDTAYKQGGDTQTAECLTRASTYTHPDDVMRVQLVHVHGSSLRPEDGYTFSLREYVQGMGPRSPWVNVLAQTLASEPFIVAGATLEEPDLEYFLQNRSPEKLRPDRGPSFLIDPYPDTGVKKECERHGLTLYVGTLEEFLIEVETAFPSRPLPIASDHNLQPSLIKKLDQRKLALFSRDFRKIVAHSSSPSTDLGFYIGRAPVLNDIALERDIARQDTARLKGRIRELLSGSFSGLLLISDNAGSGKSTTALRAVFDLAGENYTFYSYDAISYIDFDLCAEVFSLSKGHLQYFATTLLTISRL